MSAITNKPQWITDILTTLQDAGTDEAAFEMVERLTEELIGKEEKLIAMEKKVEDYDKVKDERDMARKTAITMMDRTDRARGTIRMYEDCCWDNGQFQEQYADEVLQGGEPIMERNMIKYIEDVIFRKCYKYSCNRS